MGSSFKAVHVGEEAGSALLAVEGGHGGGELVVVDPDPETPILAGDRPARP